MELKIHIHYEEVFGLLKQLSESEIEKLSKDINEKVMKLKRKKGQSYLQRLLLEAPTWSDEEYKNYLDGRKHFNRLLH